MTWLKDRKHPSSTPTPDQSGHTIGYYKLGGGGGVLPIYDIVRMCGANIPPFQRCQVYDKPPLSKKKYITDPVFHHCYMNGTIF